VNLGVNYGQGYLLGRPAEPWQPVSNEITRALATGALRTHVARPGTAGAVAANGAQRVGPAPSTTGAGPQRQVQEAMGASVRWRAPSSSSGGSAPSRPAGPINRRLNRY
jgi:hypothetical protein